MMRSWLWVVLLFGCPVFAVEFPTAKQAPQQTIEVSDYFAREVVDSGVRLIWSKGAFVDENDQRYPPPLWFIEMMPTETIDGILVGKKNDDINTIYRILSRPEATTAWQRLRFLALDLPQQNELFELRLEQLHVLVESSVPIEAIHRQIFVDDESLQKALLAMKKRGGNGFVLRHRDSSYTAENDELILVLPYQVGIATVTEHRPGRGEYTGLMGSMEVEEDGGRFLIATGFSHQERANPPLIGARIRYKYDHFTDTGKPRNPVFLNVEESTPETKKIGGFLDPQIVMIVFIALMGVLALLDAWSHRKGGAQWDLKSSITSTGLLGTFVGVWWGLYHFDTTDIVAGVPTLLEGLKLAFITSIVGITLSTVLSVWQTVRAPRD